MTYSNTRLWSNSAVVLLGYFVGIDDLFRWIDDNSFTRGLIIGTVCITLATGWLVHVSRSKWRE